MSDSYVLSLRSLGNHIGAVEEHQLSLAPRDDWSTETVQWSSKDVDVQIELQSIVDGVLVRATGDYEWSSQCARCADDVNGVHSLDVQDVFFYANAPVVTEADEDEKEDFYLIADESVDVEPLIRDEVILNLPILPLCSVDCEGLCDVCGERWTELDDEHSHESIDPRWAALSNLVSDNKDMKEQG